MSQKCHFIGIGGIGMSGLARILLKKNVEVSGSDVKANFIIHELETAGAKVIIGHSSQNISPDMTVVYSSDIKQTNPEFQAAVNLSCPMLHRSDLLAQLMSGYKTIAVAGTHGKTTTTGLLIAVMVKAGLDPVFAVGGVLPQFQVNAGYGTGEYFVAEADESDGTFLKYNPWGAIVTNIDKDHMDHFKSEAVLEESFETFMSKVAAPERLFWWGDDERLKRIKPDGISYGFGEKCALKISNFRQEGWKILFDIDFKKHHHANVEVALTGKHNALNAGAVFGMALTLGISHEDIRAAFANFKGVLRRCEQKGEIHGIRLIDDYAHHPCEIKATLKAIREGIQERRLIVAFQPHRYSRTKDCLGTFGKIFDEADELFVTDIYGAGEPSLPGLTSEAVLQEIKKASKIHCKYVPRNNLLSAIANTLRPLDVVVGLGAGDITTLGPELLAYLKRNPPQKHKIGVIYGGRSVEHEVSLMSARHVCSSLRPEYYEVVHFGITKEGRWLTGPDAMERLKSGQQDENGSNVNDSISEEVFKALKSCDLFFPVLHGKFGEDGTLQGFFEILGKPYVGCDHRSAAVCMDKALTKKLMLLNGVTTSPFIDFSYTDWIGHPEVILQQITAQLIFPIFVKPVHLGSTVGVSKAETLEDLPHAIDNAFRYDTHVIAENGLKIREIEFPVLGNRWVIAFPPGEICTNGKIYDYESKYGENAMPVLPHVDLPQALLEEGKNLASTAYKAAGCTGMARVDFFLDQENKFWLNEINPIPGFTGNSLFPKICEANGLIAQELADKLVALAFDRSRMQARTE